MSPFDPRLTVVAAQARVKTCHIFHLLHALQEMGSKFHAEAFALFAGLEVHHIERMLSTLQAHGLPERKTRAVSTKGTRLADDWSPPDDWIEWASKERRWHPADAREEAENFACYWQARSGKEACKLDWRKVWMNWVRNSRRPNGDYVPERPKQTPDERAAWLRKSIAFYNSMGRELETLEWQKELERLEGNVLPFGRRA